MYFRSVNLFSKLCFSALIICALHSDTNAQWRLGETVDNAYTTISLSAGIAAPESQYSGKPNFEKAGFAKLGYALQLDFNYAMIGNIGLTASASAIQNPIDEPLFINQRIKPALGFEVANGNLNAENWQHFVLSVGPSLSFPEELAVLELKLLLAGIYSMPANISYTDTDSFYNFERSDGLSMAADIRAGVHLRLSDPFRLIGELRYFISAPAFDYSVHSSTSLTDQLQTFSRQQRVNFFTFTLGVAYEL